MLWQANLLHSASRGRSPSLRYTLFHALAPQHGVPEAASNHITKKGPRDAENVFSSCALPLFSGNNKQIWMDLNAGWCHLCQEPIGGTLGIHLGDRDHTNLQFFLNLYAAFPRPTFAADDVLCGARKSSSFAALYHFATDHLHMDQLHVMDDAWRRSELEAALVALCEPPFSAMTHSLQGKGDYGFWYSGERIWKRHVIRMTVEMFPALSAGMTTNLTQKFWGRSNLDRLYDALNIQRIKRSYHWEPYTTKERKAFFMRQMFWELESIEMRKEVSETAKLLADLVMRRLCFEMIFLQSMEYMNRVQHVYHLLGRPTWNEIRAMDIA